MMGIRFAWPRAQGSDSFLLVQKRNGNGLSEPGQARARVDRGNGIAKVSGLSETCIGWVAIGLVTSWRAARPMQVRGQR